MIIVTAPFEKSAVRVRSRFDCAPTLRAVDSRFPLDRVSKPPNPFWDTTIMRPMLVLCPSAAVVVLASRYARGLSIIYTALTA